VIDPDMGWEVGGELNSCPMVELLSVTFGNDMDFSYKIKNINNRSASNAYDNLFDLYEAYPSVFSFESSLSQIEDRNALNFFIHEKNDIES
jgi:hypothetical protein